MSLDQLTAFAIDDPVLGALRAGKPVELEVIAAAIEARDTAVSRLLREILELRVAHTRALRRMQGRPW